MRNLTKNFITIKEFIEKSIGEWLSIRSTHSLAFQEYENSNSDINISYLDLKNESINRLLEKFNIISAPSFALKISWSAKSDWNEEETGETNETVLLFAPKDEKSGQILRDKGYTEMVCSLSEYCIDEAANLNLTTEYNSTICEEKIWFASKNVRSRYSLIKNKIGNSIVQTSLSTEIRKVISQGD